MKLLLALACMLSAQAAIVSYTVSVGAEEGQAQQALTYTPAAGSFDTNVGLLSLLTVSTGPICCNPFYPSIVSGTVNVSDGTVVPFHLQTNVSFDNNGFMTVFADFQPVLGAPNSVRRKFGPTNTLTAPDGSQGFTLAVEGLITPEPSTYAITALVLMGLAIASRFAPRPRASACR